MFSFWREKCPPIIATILKLTRKLTTHCAQTSYSRGGLAMIEHDPQQGKDWIINTSWTTCPKGMKVQDLNLGRKYASDYSHQKDLWFRFVGISGWIFARSLVCRHFVHPTIQLCKAIKFIKNRKYISKKHLLIQNQRHTFAHCPCQCHTNGPSTLAKALVRLACVGELAVPALRKFNRKTMHALGIIRSVFLSIRIQSIYFPVLNSTRDYSM